jgi:hypothetical protein
MDSVVLQDAVLVMKLNAIHASLATDKMVILVCLVIFHVNHVLMDGANVLVVNTYQAGSV